MTTEAEDLTTTPAVSAKDDQISTESAEEERADADALDLHRGAIDQTTITTQPPSDVIKQVTAILYDMGLEIQKESAFRYRCVRPRKGASPLEASAAQLAPPSPDRASSPWMSPVATPFQLPESSTDEPPSILYGPHSEDSMDEVRFSVELTKLAGLKDTYSLDIRRLKGNLRSYGFLYNTIRTRAELNQQ